MVCSTSYGCARANGLADSEKISTLPLISREGLTKSEESALVEILAGQADVRPQSKPVPLPKPHAFPSRASTIDSEILEDDGPPVGPPGTEPIPRSSQTNKDKPSPWSLRREEERSGRAAKKTSDVMNTSKYAVYRLYMQAGRNNCILTLINEEAKVRVGISAGQCGFRNSQESTYEAGYQCAVRMFDKIRDEVAERKDKTMKLEIYLKGFGQSRQALLKALTMTEGNGVRELVTRLTDKTPIKIGGVRAQKARRM